MLEQLKEQNIQNLDAVLYLLNTISESSLALPNAFIMKATLGQHIRHILEFYQCLEKGVAALEVNYDERARNVHVETSIDTASKLVEHIKLFIGNLKTDIPLKLISNFSADCDDEDCSLPTSLGRELAFVLEHTVHHLAILRMAIEAEDKCELTEEFGVANSTLRHRKSCAQ